MSNTSKIPVLPNVFPYNELLIKGLIPFKTRDWELNYRGLVLLYTSTRADETVSRSYGLRKENFPTKKIVATANLVDVKTLTKKQKEDFIVRVNPKASPTEVKSFLRYNETFTERHIISPLEYGFFFEDIKRLSTPLEFSWPRGAMRITYVDPSILESVNYFTPSHSR